MASNRFRKDELKELILEAGIRRVREEGLEVAPANLSLQVVLAAVSVETGRPLAPAQVYGRIWANQQEFQEEVISHIVRASAAPDDGTLRMIEQGVRSRPRSSPEERWETLQLLCFMGGDFNLESSLEDWRFWVGVAVSGSPLDQPSTERNVVPVEALAESIELLANAYVKVYQWVFESIGFMPKFDGALEQFTIAVSSVIEGLAFRCRYSPDLLNKRWRRTLVSSHEEVEVGFSGSAVWASALDCFDLDPDFDPSRELEEFPEIQTPFEGISPEAFRIEATSG